MSITSRSVLRALFISTILLLATCSQAQDLNYRVDYAAYVSALDDPAADVYLRITYEPNTAGINKYSNVTSISYVLGRPSNYNRIARIGFYAGQAYNDRYILADGTDLLIAGYEDGSTVALAGINSHLARFHLATVEEREQAIVAARGIVRMPEIVDSSNVQSSLRSIIVSWLKIAMSLAVAFYALWTGFSVCKAFLASRSTDSSEDWRDYAGDEAELYSSEQEWEESIMERNHLQTEWAENREAARERGEKLAVPKVYLGEDPEGNALYID